MTILVRVCRSCATIIIYNDPSPDRYEGKNITLECTNCGFLNSWKEEGVFSLMTTSCRVCGAVIVNSNRQPKIGQSIRSLANICVDCYLSRIAEMVNAAVAEMKEQEISAK